jgi:CHAD domain-containing protein
MSHLKENLVTGHFGGTEDPVSMAAQLGYRALPSKSELISDAYCDTAGFDVLRAGYSLRIRTTDGGQDVVLASLDRSGFDDLESQRFHAGGPVADIEKPLDPASWPDAVRDRVKIAAGDAPLRIVCVLHETRERVPLAKGEGDDAPVVAALLLEEVRVFESPESTGRDAIATFTELEVEPVGEGAGELVLELTKRMNAMDGAATANGSKLELALCELAESTALETPNGITAHTSMAEAGRLMWRRELLAMLLSEAGARRGLDIEYIHDMRVATRRARSVAWLFGPFFKRKALRRHMSALKQTARLLGGVRDRDVGLARLRAYAEQRSESEQLGLAEIRAVWRVERSRAYAKLIAWLDGKEYRAFLEEFSRLCWTPGLGARAPKTHPERGPMPHRVGHVMPSAILDRYEKIRSYEDDFDATAPIALETLHALRIDCKALRYCLQPVRHLLGDDADELVRRLKRLQEDLGELQDAVVANLTLVELAGSVDPAALDAYRAHQHTVIGTLAADVPTAWREFVAPKVREVLASALARL